MLMLVSYPSLTVYRTVTKHVLPPNSGQDLLIYILWLGDILPIAVPPIPEFHLNLFFSSLFFFFFKRERKKKKSYLEEGEENEHLQLQLCILCWCESPWLWHSSYCALQVILSLVSPVCCYSHNESSMLGVPVATKKPIWDIILTNSWSASTLYTTRYDCFLCIYHYIYFPLLHDDSNGKKDVRLLNLICG